MITQEGEYRAVPVAGRLGRASTGTYQIGVRLKIVDMDDSVLWYGNFANDMSFEITMKGLRAMGWTGTEIDDFANEDATLPESMNKEVRIGIVMQMGDDGLVRPKVKWVSDGGGVAMKDVASLADAKALGAQLKGKIMQFDARTRGAAPATSSAPPPAPRPKYDPPPPSDPEPVRDGDIPF